MNEKKLNNFFKDPRTNWKYILIVVILTVFVGGGILWFSTKQEVPTKFPEITKPEKVVEDETANWKTYKNEEYGFEFKYPPTYLLKDQLAGEEKAVLLGDKEFPKPDIAPWYHSPISIGPTNQSRNTAMINSLVDKTTSFIEIFGVRANVVDGKYASYPGLPNIYRAKIIIIPEKELTIWIQEHYAGEISDWDSLSATTAKMLSTFRFIEPIDTSNWKTYRNKEYGFEVKYPPDWMVLYEGPFGENIPYGVSFTNEEFKKIGAGIISVLIWTTNLEETKQAAAMVPILSERKTVINNIVSAEQVLKGQEKRILIPKEQELTYELRNTYSEFGEIFNQMLSTFKFLE